jgi:hypothetical protein
MVENFNPKLSFGWKLTGKAEAEQVAYRAAGAEWLRMRSALAANQCPYSVFQIFALRCFW